MIALIIATTMSLYAAVPAAMPTTLPTVGVEGQIELALPGTLLKAKPVTDKAPLLLRIASTQPSARTQDLWYDLRYIGLVPGAHDLKDYLVRADGSPAADLPSIPVGVVGLLPEDHKGELTRARAGGWPFFGGYRVVMGAMIVVWLAMLYPLIVAGRKKFAMAAPPTTTKLTFADRLRPLIDRAAAGTLSSDEKAKLERMLLAYWERRLHLTGDSPAEAIATLRRHPEAGELLRALEEWLHRRPGAASAIDANALLAPYRNAADVTDSEPREADELVGVGAGAGGAA
jgi:hypothetical protein